MVQSATGHKQYRGIQLTWWQQWWRAWRVLRLLLWTLWVIYRERRRVIRAHERGDRHARPNIEVLVRVLVAYRQTALKLGVLMIKLGQFLSSRADLLPEQALATLASLQDEVPPEPFSHVSTVIEHELGQSIDDIFSRFDQQAAAAASLGQVHQAVLRSNGQTVAVKVQRPNIDKLVRLDLSTLKFVIRIINRFIGQNEFIDLMAVYEEFKRTVYEEIDYLTEASNAKHFREMFAQDTRILIPLVYDEYTSRRTLVLEWVDGIKINDYAALEAAGIDRLAVANRTVEAYFRQFFEEGFFHADPHPGNIFVKPGPSGNEPIVAFVDFGMVGQLHKKLKNSLKDLFLGFVMQDSHALLMALQRLGFIGPQANMSAIEQALSLMMEQYYGMTLGQAREVDIPEVAEEISRLLYGQPFQIPAQFAFTGRAITTLVGVATGLAPQFNFVDLATPYARTFLGLDSGGVEQMLRNLPGQALEMGRTLLKLPGSLERLITHLETGQIEVKLASEGAPLRGQRSRDRRGSRRNSSSQGNTTGGFSWVLLTAVTTIGGIFLLANAHLMLPGWFLLALTGLSVLRMLVRG